MAFASPVAAQINMGEVIDPHLCAGDFNGNLSCVSNDIKINSVKQLGTPVLSCNEGGTVVLDIELDTQLNATGRYDAVVWFGKNGNNPRAVGGGACFASSLPNDPVSAFILDLEAGGDSCLDVNSSPDPVIQYFYGIEVACVDNFSPDPNGNDPDDVIAVPDGELDLFAVVTWGQSAGTLQCGDGTVEGENLEAGSNPKCDASILLGIDVQVIENPGLQLTKTGTLDDTVVAPSGVANPGDIINYTFVVENTGDVVISDITLADTVGGVSVSGGPIATLFPTEIDSTTFTATYALTQADIDAGGKNNTATVTGDSPGGGPDDVTAQDVEAVSITQVNSISLVKGASPATYDTVGASITYTYDVTNTGNTTLAGPATVADDQETVTCPALTTIGNNDGNLDPGETVQCGASHSVTQADIDGGSITNIATATVNAVNSNQDTQTVTAVQNNSVTLVKGSSPATYDTVGAVISYTYDVSNSGNTTLAGPATVSDDQETVTCPAVTTVGNNDGNLDPGESVQCTASHNVTQADIDGGSITNIATATVDSVNSNQDTETVNAIQNDSVTLVKGSSPATYDTVGALISYTYAVSNSGNTTLAGPATVSDDQATVTCPALTTIGNNDGNLDPGESVQCTASHAVTQADIDAGSITNIATATVDSIASNQDTETVNAVQNDSVTLVKGASPATYDTVGAVISYTYDVTNSGNTTLAGPATVSDNNETVTCPALTTIGDNDSDLDVGETVQCTASHTIVQADIDNGSIMNTATATVDAVNSNQDMETVNAIQTDGITLTKDASPTTYDAVDDVISYTYDITNTGNTTLAGPAVVSDDQETVTCPSLNTVGNNDDNLDVGETVQCTASHTVVQADLDNGSLTNTATATVDSVDSNQDMETVTAVADPGVTLVKAASPGTYDTVGASISYTYDVTNTGNVTLAGPATVADDQETVTCPALTTIGDNDTDLDVGETVQCTASHTVTQADIDGGSIVNVATATVDSVVSNQDTETVTAVQNDSVTLVKAASPGTYDTVGATISYTYDVSNSGNTTLTGPATVADDQETVTCPALTTIGDNDGDLDPGETVQCTASHTVTQADIDGGSVVNVATATVDSVDSNQDTETVNAVQNNSVTLVKGASPATYDTVGEVISYTYDVSNSGNTTLAGPATVADDQETVTCPALTTIGDNDSDLDVGETVQCTASHTIDQADIDAGSIVNVATATVDSVDSNQDTETVTAIQTGSLTIVKTGVFLNDGNTDGFANAGETLAFTFTITNTGNVTATDITVTDNVAGVMVTGGPLASLAPGATDNSTFSATYTLTFNDIVNGFFSNLATVEAASAAGAILATDTEFVELQVENAIVPTMSQWALMLMTLLLLLTGWRYFPVRAFRQ
jgi:uncharacterized repeat protein (TIGR01451 family)